MGFSRLKRGFSNLKVLPQILNGTVKAMHVTGKSSNILPDRAMGKPIGLWLGRMADQLFGTRGFTAVRLDRGGLLVDRAVLGNDRAGADGTSVVWREGGVCQTLLGRGGRWSTTDRRSSVFGWGGGAICSDQFR
jgi:hypothetical protein